MPRLGWVLEGLRTGILTTPYPRRPDAAAVADLRVRPLLDRERCEASAGCEACVYVCLPGALTIESVLAGADDGGSHQSTTLSLHLGKCIGCGLCAAACPSGAISMVTDVELAVRDASALVRAAPIVASARPKGERASK